jgi:DNA-directed RNA polymerase specialized sigma subunit
MTIVGAILPKQISSMKPTKRKVIRTVYTAEKVTKSIQKDVPVETRGIVRSLSDACKNLRIRLTQN